MQTQSVDNSSSLLHGRVKELEAELAAARPALSEVQHRSRFRLPCFRSFAQTLTCVHVLSHAATDSHITLVIPWLLCNTSPVAFGMLLSSLLITELLSPLLISRSYAPSKSSTTACSRRSHRYEALHP